MLVYDEAIIGYDKKGKAIKAQIDTIEVKTLEVSCVPYMDEFYKGFAAAAQAGDDKKLAAYYAGIQIGQQIGTQVFSAANSELFGQDSTKTINLQQLVAGFIEGAKGEPIVPIETIRTELNKRVDAYKDQYLSKTFGDNKKKSEDFIAKKAKEEGIQKLPGGTLYKVLSEGNGALPTDSSKVKVDYEGKTIDGKVFDSSIKRGQPMECVVRQNIPGFAEALTHMPVGSEWEVYIPAEKAYGERDMGQIKPFSTLIFKVKLLSIEK